MSSETVWMIGGLAALILGFLAAWKLEIITYIYDARPGAAGIDFCLFRLWKVHFLPYSQIESVEVNRGWGSLVAYHFKNRLFRPAFLIRKKQGGFARRILITPRNSEEFARVLQDAQVPLKGGRADGP